MSGENIKLTHLLCHQLWRMVLIYSILFSYTLPYMEKNIRVPGYQGILFHLGNLFHTFEYIKHMHMYVARVRGHMNTEMGIASL